MEISNIIDEDALNEALYLIYKEKGEAVLELLKKEGRFAPELYNSEYKYVTDKIHEFQTRMERKRSQEESMQFNQASDYRPVRDSSKEPTLTQNSMSSTSTLTPMSAVGSLAASTATSVSIANGANHHVDSTAPCCTSMSGPAAMSTASAMMSSAPSTATLASTVSSAASYSSLSQSSLSSSATLTSSLASTAASIAAAAAAAVGSAASASNSYSSNLTANSHLDGPSSLNSLSSLSSAGANSNGNNNNSNNSNGSSSTLANSNVTLLSTMSTISSSTAQQSSGNSSSSTGAELQLRAQLPMNQHTTVPIRPGATVRDLLEKKLTTRSLKPEDCRVYIKETRTPVQWDADATELAQQQHLKIVELVVESKNIDSLAKRKLQSYHTFQRKTFFTTIVYCCKCSKILFSGFRCQTCQARYHQRCCDSVLYMPCPVNSGQPHLQGSVRYPDVDGLNVVQNFGQNDPSMLLHNHHHHHRNVGGAAAYRHRGGGGHQPHYPTHSAAAAAAAAAAKTHRERSSSAPNVSNLSVNVSRQDGGKAGTNIVFPTATLAAAAAAGAAAAAAAAAAPAAPLSMPASATLSRRHREGPNGEILPPHQRRRRDSRDEWEIPHASITRYECIGSGSFGTVYRGFWHGHVAIKELNVTDQDATQMQAFRNEVAVLRKTRHENVLLFIGCVSKPRLAIITQWCNGSSLYRRLHVMEEPYGAAEILDISKQTAQGMDYLHARGIIHRDLKSNNILLHEGLVKIGDFGLATVKTRWSGSHQFRQPSGSILWMAPEVIRMKDDDPYTVKSDVYAFGVVLYELCSGQLPYNKLSNKDLILFKVGSGLLRPDIKDLKKGTPKRIPELMTKCVQFDRDQRPSFKFVLEELEGALQLLPRIQRSSSEPTLNRSNFYYKPDDSDLIFAQSPMTPMTGLGGEQNFVYPSIY
ncbi:hypothetical protein BOX15_Mlig020430g1 [Macrostomum lignano]|uniref:non-specific serine/threonine protein kinase n=1 Tax=Macrostomum lignano TaxID=282301 RepID=A0A267EN37_9PLAT|nr:hypothetical protein BOX15_Mlig020430g1 [Macrostomum lignano]